MSKFFTILLVAVLLIGYTGCSVNTGLLRQYNHDNLQDGACYASYGGQWGYCDAPRGTIK